jgi:hypothetical protein
LGKPGTCVLMLSWIVVVSMKSKSPPEALIEVSVASEVPKVIFCAVPETKVP